MRKHNQPDAIDVKLPVTQKFFTLYDLIIDAPRKLLLKYFDAKGVILKCFELYIHYFFRSVRRNQKKTTKLLLNCKD